MCDPFLYGDARRAALLGVHRFLAASWIHDLRGPLNAMSLNVDLLAIQGVGSDDLHSTTRALREEVTRCARHLSLLGELWLPVASDTVTLPEVAHHVAELFASTCRRATIDLHVDAPRRGSGTLLFERAAIREPLLHLLVNAVEVLAPSGGTITLTASDTALEVADSGPGVEPELIEKIFEPRFSTAPKHAGLGLTVTREIVASLGGALELVPSSAGAHFRITFSS